MNTISQLTNSELYAVWFSASYCSWCNKFAPRLKQFSEESNIPILLCGSDKTLDVYNDYAKKNDWTISIPFENEYRQSLREIYNIKTIPALIFFKQQMVLEKNGRELVRDYDTDYILRKFNEETNFDSDDDF